MPALRASSRRMLRSTRSGNALVETALVVPLLLLVAFGVVGVGRITAAQMGVSAVAREAAVSASLANTADEAALRGLARGNEVATGYQLTNGSLQLRVDPGSFARGAPVTATATYHVALDDLPLLSWMQLSVASNHTEWTDPYRSRWIGGGSP